MTLRALSPLAVVVLVALAGISPAAPDAPAGVKDIVVQTRGPVHEGYAQPFDATPEPGPMVPKAPPEPVPELPPDQKPEGDNVQWIPGYWNWDSEKNDYVWVSGFWRAAPPQRKWVAGYWQKTDDGWEWVGGYWAPENQDRPPLLDPPPEPLETGPNVPAPDDRSMYVPGSWMWRNERYLWRPGFWSPARLGWVWVPAHYVWTPGGYVFVDGYWDFPLESRGVLFAPVVFERPLWQTPGWCYRPSYVVGIDTPFFANLFVGPTGNQYCFGDYFEPAYLRAGYRPWSVYGPRRHDPLYSYYRGSHRDDPAWLRGVNATYAGRRDGSLTRPPRTLAEQTTVVRRAAPGAASGLTVVQPLSDLRGVKLASIDRTQVARHQAAAQRIVDGTRQRVQHERPSQRGRRDGSSAGPTRTAPAAPIIVNRPSADHPAPYHTETHAPAHHAAPTHTPEWHSKPSAPAVTYSAPPPVHHAASAPPAHHANPAPAHHAAHAHAASGGHNHAKQPHGGGGHKKK